MDAFNASIIHKHKTNRKKYSVFKDKNDPSRKVVKFRRALIDSFREQQFSANFVACYIIIVIIAQKIAKYIFLN